MVKKNSADQFRWINSQNLSSVLIVAEVESSASTLTQAFLSCHYKVIKRIAESVNLVEKIRQYKPDILVMVVDLLTQKNLREFAQINQFSALPIVLFSEREIPAGVQGLINANVSIHVGNTVQPDELKSSISAACNKFNEYQSLRYERQKTKEQLKTDKLVKRATRLLMQQKNINERDAYNRLQELAADN
ncbi:MAG: ANTAR domain-containing protein, partial [Psychromonas sp.]